MLDSNVSSAPTFDRRLTPARPDLAAASLRGKVEAARFVEGSRRGIVEGTAPLRRAPDHGAALETEALFGESVTVYEEREGWAWAQLERDSYVGFIPVAALGPPAEPTHRLVVPRSFAYRGASIKLPPTLALSLGAHLRIVEQRGDFVVTGDGLHIFARHCAPIGVWEADFVAVAERFLETPYLWGGRTWNGIDCSGLVQTALAETGVAAPRDSDMMEAALGEPLAFEEALDGLRRGDLVFWKGHIGVMRDTETLLHANGWHMRVVSEPLRAARDRTRQNGGGEIASVRRFAE
jgi:cell wall-associated NlpC family hydrolase